MKNNIEQHSYWDGLWKNTQTINRIMPYKKGIKNYVARQQHQYFYNIFKDKTNKGLKILEIGCANSAWLTYFKEEFDLDVYGIDYSETGCENARQILDNNNINGKIFCANLFEPPEELLGAFDYIISFGVFEHFENTKNILYSANKFLKPEGIMITTIPNVTGFIGWVSKVLNRPVYDLHMPISKDILLDACEEANLEVISCDYFLSTSWSILNLNNLPKNTYSYKIKRIVQILLVRCSFVVFFLESIFRKFPTSQNFSPYIHCITKNKEKK